MDLMHWLVRVDKQLFTWIQVHCTASWLDPLMVLSRNPLTWIPVYVFVLYWIVRYDRKLAIRFILVTLIAVGFTDYTAASLIKPLVGRIRPCFDPDTWILLRNLVGCGGRYSFPSNHAANHFCMATLWFYTIRGRRGRSWYWLWVWAALVSYAQVYVGKHFPLGGALYGSLVGWYAWRILRRLSQNIDRGKLPVAGIRVEKRKV
jgi:membrane-associated phospholipid phosphatase